MKVLEVKEIRELDSNAIIDSLNKLKKELFNLKLKSKTTGLDKPHLLKIIKSNIARLKMVQGESALSLGQSNERK